MYANGVEEKNKDNPFVLFVAKVVHLWYVDRPTACHARDAPISKPALNQHQLSLCFFLHGLNISISSNPGQRSRSSCPNWTGVANGG